MTPSNGNIFRVTGNLCGEFTDHRWIPLTTASDAELCCFLWSAPELTVEWGWWFETSHYDVTVMKRFCIRTPNFLQFNLRLYLATPMIAIKVRFWDEIGPMLEIFRTISCLSNRWCLLGCFFLTHSGRDNMTAISQTTYLKIFSWMEVFNFWLKFAEFCS